VRQSIRFRGRGNRSFNSQNLIARTVRNTLRGQTASAVAVMVAMSAGVHAQTQSSDNSDTSEDQKKAFVLQEVVVTSRRAAIESADDRKKNSESIIDSVTADDAGKLPDVSIDEVLQRVPGVTITRWGDPDHFQAQGSSVQVRGLSGVAGRINGEEVFSANGGNGLSWTDIPPELMAGVDVYKAATADLIEGGTGGQIDLRTKMPFDYNKFEFQASANGDYADFRKKTSPTGSALITDTWDTDAVGKIGILVDLAYGKYSSRTDFMSIEPFYKTLVDGTNRYIPGGFDYGTQDYDRTRKGAYAALEWEPIENLTLTQTYFESKYQQTTIEQDVFMDTTTLTADPSVSVFDPSGGLVKSGNLFVYNPTSLGTPAGNISGSGVTQLSTYSSDTRDLSTSFKFNGGSWALKGGFQQVDSSTNTLSYYVFPNVPFAANGYGLDLTGIATLTVPASTQAALSNPADYSYGATMSYISGNVARLRAEHLDYEYTISEDRFFRSFEAGARYADHTETDQSSNYNYTGLCAGWNGCAPVTFAEGKPGDYSAAPFTNFFQGKIPLPGNVYLPSLAMVARANPIADHALYGGGNLTTGIAFVPGDTAVVDYKDTALFGLVRFADELFGIPYQGNAGLRVVHAQHESQGYYIQSSGSYEDPATLTVYTLSQTSPEQLSGSRSDTEVLPSLNLMLRPNEHWQTRFNYSETMDLPNVSQIQSNGTLSVSTRNLAASNNQNAENGLNGWTATFGNPDLKPVTSHNFDLTQEWYPKPGTAVHIDAFHKSIDNWLEFNNVSRLWPVVYTTGTVNTLINYQTYTNSSQRTTINGVEVGAHTYFDMLPGPLKGFGLDANYTFIDSKNPGDVYYDINGLPHNDAPVAGLSRYNYNAALLYDYRWWSARLAYNWRSEYLLSTNTNGANGSYTYYSANTPATTNCQSPAATTCQYIKMALPVYSAPYGQLDFGVTLRPSEHFYASFQVANLTNTIVKSTWGGYPGGQYPRNWFISDRHFNLTLGYKF
jgi:iron complex outermembrane receptor protein